MSDVAEKPQRSRQQKARDKGKRIMAIAVRLFKARGCLVETAPNVTKWIPTPGGLRPRSMRHDFFGVWDAIVVDTRFPSSMVGVLPRPFFVQVTSVNNISERRTKILGSLFPCSRRDLILGYRGRNVFRVLRGPRFQGHAEEWTAPPLKREKK